MLMVKLKTFVYGLLIAANALLPNHGYAKDSKTIKTNSTNTQYIYRQLVDPILYRPFHNTIDSNKAGIPNAQIIK